MKNGLIGKTDYDFSRALLELENLMDGASIKFILIGEIAKRLKEGLKLDGLEKIEVAVPKLQLSEYAISALKNLAILRKIGEDWQHPVLNGIPIEIKIIERKYKFFKYPDRVVHWGGYFNIPNPMNVYWKTRFLIK